MRAEVCSTQPHRIAKAAEQTMFFFLLVLVGDLPFYRLKRVYKYSSTVPCEPKVTKNTGTNALQVKLSQMCPKSPWHLVTSAFDMATWLLPAFGSCFYIYKHIVGLHLPSTIITT